VRAQTDPATVLEGNDLLNVLPDAVIALDVERRVSFWNRAAEVAYGFSADEALGADPVELLRTSFPLPLAELLQTLAETGRWQGNLLVRTSAGAELTVQSRWALTYGEQGEITGSVGVDRDVGPSTEAVAHDLNNLLAIIINYGAVVTSELEAEHSAGEPERRAAVLAHLGEIGDAASRAARLTHQLLDVPEREIDAPLKVRRVRRRPWRAG
jgi:PAS domain S-box-containing protein